MDIPTTDKASERALMLLRSVLTAEEYRQACELGYVQIERDGRVFRVLVRDGVYGGFRAGRGYFEFVNGEPAVHWNIEPLLGNCLVGCCPHRAHAYDAALARHYDSIGKKTTRDSWTHDIDEKFAAPRRDKLRQYLKEMGFDFR